MSIGMLLWSLAWFILFFVCLIVFSPYLSVLAYGVGWLYGAFRLIFDMFAYIGADCWKISTISWIISVVLLTLLLLKIYKIFKWSSGS